MATVSVTVSLLAFFLLPSPFPRIPCPISMRSQGQVAFFFASWGRRYREGKTEKKEEKAAQGGKVKNGFLACVACRGPISAFTLSVCFSLNHMIRLDNTAGGRLGRKDKVEEAATVGVDAI